MSIDELAPEGLGSRTVDVDDVPEAQRLDHVLLLSPVDDPLSMAGQLTRKDRQRLRARSEMANADQRAWASLPVDAGDGGRAAYRLLIARPERCSISLGHRFGAEPVGCVVVR